MNRRRARRGPVKTAKLRPGYAAQPLDCSITEYRCIGQPFQRGHATANPASRKARASVRLREIAAWMKSRNTASVRFA